MKTIYPHEIYKEFSEKKDGEYNNQNVMTIITTKMKIVSQCIIIMIL